MTRAEFSVDDGNRIAKAVRKSENRKRAPTRGSKKRVFLGKNQLTIQAPSGGIPAANNYQFGFEECKILRSDEGTWKDTGLTEMIFNPSTEDELTDGLRLGWAIWDGSEYVLISKLCGDDRDYTSPAALDGDMNPEVPG